MKATQTNEEQRGCDRERCDREQDEDTDQPVPNAELLPKRGAVRTRHVPENHYLCRKTADTTTAKTQTATQLFCQPHENHVQQKSDSSWGSLQYNKFVISSGAMK